jgi:hypothetical protein
VTHRTEWGDEALTKLLAKRPALVISSDDGLAEQAKVFAGDLRRHGDTRVTELHLATDHSYSDKRIALETAVLDWLTTLPVH